MCMRILPFLLILFIKLIVDHVLALVSISISIICLFIADAQLTRAIASSRSGSSAYVCCLLKAFVASALWMIATTIFFDDSGDNSSLLGDTMRFRLSIMQSTELCATIYAIVLTDFAAKIISIQFKIMVSCCFWYILSFILYRYVLCQMHVYRRNVVDVSINGLNIRINYIDIGCQHRNGLIIYERHIVSIRLVRRLDSWWLLPILH